MLELVRIAKLRMPDEGRGQSVDTEQQGNRSGRIADQHQQAAPDFDDDDE
jgi:hypothetical protein